MARRKIEPLNIAELKKFDYNGGGNMGGRGSVSGLAPSGRNISLKGLMQQISNNQSTNGPQWMYQGDYTDDNNPAP